MWVRLQRCAGEQRTNRALVTHQTRPCMQSTPAGEGAAGPGVASLLGDAEYLRSVLGSLPGVDPNDPALQNTLRDLQVNLHSVPVHHFASELHLSYQSTLRDLQVTAVLTWEASRVTPGCAVPVTGPVQHASAACNAVP